MNFFKLKKYKFLFYILILITASCASATSKKPINATPKIPHYYYRSGPSYPAYMRYSKTPGKDYQTEYVYPKYQNDYNSNIGFQDSYP